MVFLALFFKYIGINITNRKTTTDLGGVYFYPKIPYPPFETFPNLTLYEHVSTNEELIIEFLYLNLSNDIALRWNRTF